METIYFLDLTSVVSTIEEQLAIEEALFRTDDRNWCLVNRGSLPRIVMGISGKPEELLHVERVEAEGVPVIRRYSGGGTVVVDHNTLFVSFIGNHSLLSSRPFPKLIMEWSASLYAPLFDGHSFHLRCQDYALGEKKIGGNAQSIAKNRFVHHTTFLWDYDPNLMALLTLPSKQPAYRQGRSHDDFITTMNGRFGSPQEFFNGLKVRLALPYKVSVGDLADLNAVQGREHRKATKKVILSSEKITAS